MTKKEMHELEMEVKSEKAKARRLTLPMKRKLWTLSKADSIFSRWIRERDKWCIFKCGNPATQNSHFWGRGHSATRYDPENCDGICGGCHMRHEGNKQGLYRDIKIAQLGLEKYDKLALKHNSVVKRSDAIAEIQKLLDQRRL